MALNFCCVVSFLVFFGVLFFSYHVAMCSAMLYCFMLCCAML